jgi:hypothetical protein
MRRRPQTIEDTGHDSFLDIVANLVGILVILIMVVGVRAREAWQQSTSVTPLLSTATVAPPDAELPPPLPVPAPTIPESPPPVSEEELASWRARAASAREQVKQLEQDAFRLDAEVTELNSQASQEQQDRNELQYLVSVAELALKERRTALDAHVQERLKLSAGLAAARKTHEELTLQIQSLQQTASAPEIIAHHPTPLAKTVFGREEHFRLLAGRLAHIPMNELTEQLRQDAQNKLWKLKEADQITETIGPLEGFWLKYTLRRFQRPIRTETGMAVRRTIELDRFVLVPVAENLGVPLAAALRPDSELGQRLAALRPDDTTITVWTYPDSFEEFRQLKDHLFERGYLAAARPLPHGYPISGSPDGSKSLAE